FRHSGIKIILKQHIFERNARILGRLWPYRPLILSSIYSSTFRRTRGGSSGDERIRLMIGAVGPARLGWFQRQRLAWRSYHIQRRLMPRVFPQVLRPVLLSPGGCCCSVAWRATPNITRKTGGRL